MLLLPPLGELLAIFVGWLLAAIGWIKWLYELRDKRPERAAKEKAEAALAIIRRRATESSPLFLVSKEKFNGVTAPSKNPTDNIYLPAGHACLLCYIRDEVDRKMPAGEFIYLLVKNHGSAAYEIAMRIAGEPAGFVEVEADHCPAYAIRYAYRPEHHGRDQTLEVTFLAANGIRDTHRYATAHGIKSLRRVDPA